MIDFFSQSKTFLGFTFSGNYTMPDKHLKAIYDHYLQTGENLLDDYTNVIHVSWDCNANSDIIVDNRTYRLLMDSVFAISKLGVFKETLIHDCMCFLSSRNNDYNKWLRENTEDKIARKKACAYTAKPEVKKQVFKLHGKKCLSCGSTKNITIDHVVPVSKGGKNEIDNLQPLCKPCNSRKSDNEIDYRP